MLKSIVQVLICDNLALPFRDESFDAVLSIAVVHHFATIERRVHALKELARVLRIGGRLVISVWAMEQKHRKVKEIKMIWNTFKSFFILYYYSIFLFLPRYIYIIFSYFYFCLIFFFLSEKYMFNRSEELFERTEKLHCMRRVV